MAQLSADEVIALVTRKPDTAPALHLNVRLTRDDAKIYQGLQQHTPGLTDSQRVKDSLRLATYLVVKKDPVVQKLGVFQTQEKR